MKPLDLGEAFRKRVRDYPKETRGKIGRALQQMERDFGNPHRHSGLGVRRPTGDYFEIRMGLDIRLVFQNRADCLLVVMAGNHGEVQKFLRGIWAARQALSLVHRAIPSNLPAFAKASA